MSAAIPQINLHWHDLRRDFTSRLVERGVPLAQVCDLLGHASILHDQLPSPPWARDRQAPGAASRTRAGAS